MEDRGFTQRTAAEKLGTTQAAISQYLSSKRGETFIKKLKNNPQTQSTIREIIDELAEGTLSSEEVQDKFCELCECLRQSDMLDDVQ